MPWLYSGVTKTNASNEATLADHALVCSFAYCPSIGATGSSSSGRSNSLMSTSSNSASLRVRASSWTQRATSSHLRPGRVLPVTIATFSMAELLERPQPPRRVRLLVTCRMDQATRRLDPERAAADAASPRRRARYQVDAAPACRLPERRSKNVAVHPTLGAGSTTSTCTPRRSSFFRRDSRRLRFVGTRAGAIQPGLRDIPLRNRAL